MSDTAAKMPEVRTFQTLLGKIAADGLPIPAPR